MSLFHAVVGGSGGSRPVLTGNAVEGDVLAGKTFYNTDASIKKTGAMANKKGQLTAVSTLTPGATNNDEYTSFMMPENGCFDTSSELKIPTDELKRINSVLAQKGSCMWLTGYQGLGVSESYTLLFLSSTKAEQVSFHAGGSATNYDCDLCTITGSKHNRTITMKKDVLCYAGGTSSVEEIKAGQTKAWTQFAANFLLLG